MRPVFLLVLTLILTLGSFPFPLEAATVRSIVFPVIGTTTYRDDFGDPRVDHTHEGNDIFGKKMMLLVAAADGTVAFVAFPQPDWGYAVHIRDSEGYQYRYLHMNNDTPGTDDGQGGAMFAYAPDISNGKRVVKGQLIGWMGDSGNAEATSPHLHFEIRSPDGTPFSPFESLQAATRLLAPVTPPALEGEILPYANLALPVSVAIGNFDSDSAMEIVTGAGVGGGPHVRTFGADGTPAGASFYAYSSEFTGGIDVATGDVDGDGIDEIITGAGPTGGPHVRIFKADGTPIGSFYAYAPEFLGGVHVAAADLNGDGKAEIITGAGPGGGPHVKIFRVDGTTPLQGFFAFEGGFTGGVDVAASPTAGGNAAAIIAAKSAGSQSVVRIFNSSGLLQREFSAYDEAFRGGVRVSTGNILESSSAYEIATAPESVGGPHFKLFSYLGEALDDTHAFDEWWMGGFDVAAGKGTVFGAAGGRGLSGPAGRRASIRGISFQESGTPNWWNDSEQQRKRWHWGD